MPSRLPQGLADQRCLELIAFAVNVDEEGGMVQGSWDLPVAARGSERGRSPLSREERD